MAAGLCLLFPQDLVDLTWQSLWSQIFLANIYYWKTINYFGLHADSVFLLHTWSLAVEEQFYLFFPALLIIACRIDRKGVWRILATVFALSFALNVAFVVSKPEATFYLFPTRAWELLIGSFVSLLAAHRLSDLLDQLLGAIGVVLIVLGLALYGVETSFPGYIALFPTVGAACLIFSGMRGTSAASRLLGLGPFRYIGQLSYSLYLVHWPINIFAGYVFGKGYTWPWRAAMFLLSIMVAVGFYHLVETPFRRRRFFAKDRELVLRYFAGVGASVMVFLLVVYMDGIPRRFSPDILRIAAAVNDKPRLDPGCEFDPAASHGEPGYCHIGAVVQDPTWLVIGDSHAWAAYDAIDEWLKRRRQGGVFSFRHGCLPIDGVSLLQDQGACIDFTASNQRLLTKNPEIRDVFLVSTWRQVSEARISDSSSRKLNQAEAVDLFDRQFAVTANRISHSGRQLVVWEPLPGAKGNVPITLARARLSNAKPDIAFERSEYEKEFAFLFPVLEKNRTLIAARFSPSQALCGSGKCIVEMAGRPLYFDTGHPAASFSGFWADELDKQLGSLR